MARILPTKNHPHTALILLDRVMQAGWFDQREGRIHCHELRKTLVVKDDGRTNFPLHRCLTERAKEPKSLDVSKEAVVEIEVCQIIDL